MFLACLTTGLQLSAQDTPTATEPDTLSSISGEYNQPMYDFTVVARSYGDSVVLRWAPQNAGVWLSANYYG